MLVFLQILIKISKNLNNKINECSNDGISITFFLTPFLKKLNISRALDIIETEREPTEIRDEILDFIRNSNRGVMKGFGNS